jgi:hypothetical protein
MCLPITLGENHGSGHFYLAETRTFLLCVDMLRWLELSFVGRGASAVTLAIPLDETFLS